MSQHEKYWICDVGGERHETRPRNDIVIANGENSRIYGDVCDKHIAEVTHLIDKEFPRNKNVE